MIKNISILLFLLSTYFLVPSQIREDTILNWKKQFATLGGVPYISNEGSWIGINKYNAALRDSSYIVNTQNNQVHKIFGTGPLVFMNGTGVLSRKDNKVQFLNLITGSTYRYDKVLKFCPLDKLNRYAILTTDKHIRIYSSFGQQLLDISNVEDIAFSESLKSMFLKRNNSGRTEILETSGEVTKVIHFTEGAIKKMELILSAKLISFTETTVNNDQSDRLVVMDIQSTPKNILNLDIPKNSSVKFSEILDGKALLISARKNLDEHKDSMVELWYGNDPYINEHDRIVSTRKFWLFNPANADLQKITVPENIEVNSINSSRYFLTYTPRAKYNYVTSNPELNGTQIFDLKKNTYINIGDLKVIKQYSRRSSRTKDLISEIFASPDGRWFIASLDGLKWTLFKANGQKESLLDAQGLGQPTFSQNRKNIYFESSNGLWIYDIYHHNLRHSSIGIGKVTKIKNCTIKPSDQYKTSISSLKTEEILVEIYDTDENIVSYQLFRDGKWQELIPPTKNRIDSNNMIFNTDMTTFYTVEENYNLPPAIYTYNIKHQNHLLFDGNIKDVHAKKLKQEIYTYSAVGRRLNGILYYPLNFDPRKKYPMVVHIYEMQRETSNEYLSPNNLMPVGFQIRTLMERGYFVYLPDIAFGERGTGLSALECVNNALDQVLVNPNIDKQKIGLIGHSHGGYETNFIATNSSRFTTYISGAGNSDLIRSYYSYNTQFVKPFYFQFETGQYDMRVPIVENKNLYLQNSPILNVEKVNAPILLWAGKKDTNIQWDQVMEFYIGLRRYNKNVIALFYPNGGHDLVFEPKEAEDRNRRILQWWDYFLKDRKDVAWINKQIRKDTE
ncbi:MULTISPECIES: S9 family peptidase [Bacteroidota]|uniref:Prolyl oligopeptidase family n=2 Tax=Bacteroidota TaxID=976 RepID=A0A2X2LZN9_SPHMU|nr:MULTISPECIES: prolyl oligopeptidase family serine peptidase [Bacteroidota]AZB25142.1 S9 family peptidase [Chryseobacterium bernardetii]QRQ63230.1 S9 family peptidase [Sphingobacterium multivorum]SPZ95070.1 Prolyl oligopeptidase family [Sphingobacterium multivorum]